MNSVRPISVIGKQRVGQANSWDRSLISVRPNRYVKETESLHCELNGTDRSSRLDRNVTKGKREFAIPSR